MQRSLSQRSFPASDGACRCVENMRPGSQQGGLDHGASIPASLSASSFWWAWAARTGSLICQGMSASVCVVNLVLIRMITFFSKHVVPAQRQSEQGPAKFSFLLMRGTDFGESWLRTSCHRGNYLATLEVKCHMWLLHIVKILLSIGICQQAVWKEVKWLGCL